MTEVDLFWDSNIKEFEVDPSWKEHEIYKSSQYKEYRTKWGEVSKGKYLSSFPLNIEMEPTYYCNLKCPMVQELLIVVKEKIITWKMKCGIKY